MCSSFVSLRSHHIMMMALSEASKHYVDRTCNETLIIPFLFQCAVRCDFSILIFSNFVVDLAFDLMPFT